MHLNRRSKYRRKKTKVKFSIMAVLLLIIFGFTVYFIKIHFFTSGSSEFDDIIIPTARQYSIDPLFIKAVIWRESNFNPNAVGTKGEIGLMQLMMKSSVKDWANSNKREMPERGVVFNPWLNIEIGTWYLAWCRKQWRNYRNPEVLALATYNAGYSNVKKWVPKKFRGDNIIELIKFPSTKKYILNIMEKYRDYKKSEKDN